MFSKFWDFVVDSALLFFIPLVCWYLTLTSNLFLNVSCNEAKGLEKLGNELLIPCQYLFVGQIAKKNEKGEWTFSNRFDYLNGHFTRDTFLFSLVALPSFLLGVTVKAFSLFTEESRNHQRSMYKAKLATKVDLHDDLYRSYGIELENGMEWFTPKKHQRRPGDENHMAADKQCLREIAAVFNEAKLLWWVDCGTCLGAYRYGGIIPWDEDIDIAVLLDDFDNVKRALNRLDPKKYIVQDWSSREHPKSYLKVYIRESHKLIDIYHFKIHPQEKKIQYLFALENNIFFPEWWRNREKKFTVPISFDSVFPLKKAMFDDVEVNVPRDIENYLRRYYGSDLSPVKIYDPRTKKYEKDMRHPYWQQAHVH